MKKYLVLLFLMVLGTSLYAQKSYVNVVGPPDRNINNTYYLSGAIPSDMKSYYYADNGVYIGDILNMLAERGFVVEQMSYDSKEVVILSKDNTTPSNQTLIEGDVNNDGEVTISDVNKVINIILGIVKENPSLLEQYGIIKPE